MLKSKMIVSDEDLNVFLSEYNSKNVAPLSTEELKKAQVRVFYMSGSNKIVAGYCLNCSPPFRYLDIIPRDAANDILAQLGEKNICEGYAAWIDKSVKSKQRLFFYLVSMMDALRKRKKYILSGTMVAKIKEKQMMMLPYLIYEGTAEAHGKVVTGWAYYGTKTSIIRGYVKYIFSRNTLRHAVFEDKKYKNNQAP
jgi:hypothetical protein